MTSAPEPDRARLQDQAVEWLIRLDAENCPAADRAAFREWLRLSPEHQAAYAEIARRMQWLERVGAADSAGRHAALRYRPAKPFAFSRPAGLAAAAAVLLGLGLATFSPLGWYGYTRHFSAETGARQSVKLADGTQLELNTDSEVAVRINRNLRHVDVLKGEVYFTVVHNPDRPFVVTAGAGRTIDIGTEFEVYRRPDKVVVAVREGSVLLEAKQSRYLSAAQAAAYDSNGDFVDTAANVESLSAWRRGKLIFDNRRLDEVLAEIGRYHKVQLQLADPKLAVNKVSGTFFIERLEGNLATIANSLNLTVQHSDNGKIVLVKR